MSERTITPKRERSPTPPLNLTPKTSGVKLIAPLPASCKKSSPNFMQARKAWLRGEIIALNELGLTVMKKFIRDDGLSLEWESSVPVWPDTLKPATSSSVSPASVVHQDVSQDHQDAPSSERDEEAERKAIELEDMAVEFLKKYVETFDTNREALATAYADNALFSYCVHEHSNIPRNSVAAAFTNPSAAVHRFAPRKGSRNILQTEGQGTLFSGPLEISAALLSLGPHKFCARSPTDLRWNVLALQLGSESKSSPCVFLSSHGDLVEERAGSEKRLSFDQCFFLRRPEESESSRASSADWPLVAVNHQLTVRDLSLRPVAL